MTLHIVTGPPCAGKSTYVAEHAKDGDVRVDFDLLAQALGFQGRHCSKGHVRSVTYAARKAAIAYLMEHADSTEFDGWVIHSSPRAEQMEEYEACGAQFHALDTDMETCLARAVEDERPEETAEHIREWFNNMEKSKQTIVKSAQLEYQGGGTVAGYISTFDREPDSYGDIVAPGAFAETIADWAEKNGRGLYLPLLYGHNTDDPFYNIGRFTELREDERGLYGVAEFDPDNPTAQYVRKLAQEGRLYQFSFAYSVEDAAQVELENGATVNELRKLTVYEGSLVQIPANQHAEVVEVKGLKYGRRNSAADVKELESIRDMAEEIVKAINGLLAEMGQQEESGEDGDAKSADRDPRIDTLLKYIDNIEQ